MKNARNLAANLTAFVVTFGISFFLSPFIVRTLGVEANGLINLSTSFLNYASILTAALTSVIARFVTIEVRQGDEERASEYYTAAYANTLLGAAFLLPVMVMTVINFGTWFDVPIGLVSDAQLLASLLFANFLLTLVLPRWTVGTYATNNLHLDSLRTMQSVLIKGGLILILFLFLRPAMAYVGLATLIAGVFAMAFSGYYKRRLLPNVRVRFSDFRLVRMGELLAAGFWNSVNFAGNMLSTGFHLLLANLILGATPAGLLALSMTVPAMVNQLAMNISSVFLPSLAFAYAEKDYAGMRRQAKRAMSITALLTMLPLAALIVFGEAFFSLWVPSLDSTQLGLMSIAAAVGLVVACGAQPLQNVFVITNSQRAHSTASVLLGVANVTLSVVLLTLTDWGVYAILASAAVTVLVRVLAFTAPMAGRRVQAAWAAFLPEIARSVGYLAVLVGVGSLIRLVHQPASWIGFFVVVAVMCAIGSLVNILVLTGRTDRQLILSVVKRILPWKR